MMKWRETAILLPECKKMVVGYWPGVGFYSKEKIEIVYDSGVDGFYRKEDSLPAIAPTYWTTLPGGELDYARYYCGKCPKTFYIPFRNCPVCSSNQIRESLR